MNTILKTQTVNQDSFCTGIVVTHSGNPSFIKEVNDVLGFYRISHEAAVDDDLDESQVEYICSVNELVGEE